ncbi:MAG: hypothetical protein PHE29_09445 [Tissierellia bacterium]|nr:hypothetical protein [Tissierellia bacterium]
MNYKWNIQEIIDDLNLLLTKYKNNDYCDKFKIIDGMSMTILMLDSLDKNQFYLSNKKTSEIIEEVTSIIKKEDMIDIEDDNNSYELKYDESTPNLLKKIFNMKTDNITEDVFIDYDLEEFIAIIKEFLKTIDVDLYDLFCQQLSDEKINIIDRKDWKFPYIGSFFTVNQLKKSYITTPYEKYLSYLCGIVHEFAHMVNTISIDYETIDDNFWDYVEIISLFMEQIFKLYLKEQSYIKEEDYINSQMYLINYTKDRARKLYDAVILDKIMKKTDSPEEIKSMLRNEYLFFSEEYLNDLLNNSIGSQMLYITNQLMALQLFHYYKSNRKSGKEIVTTLAKMKSKEDLIKLNVSFDNDELYKYLVLFMNELQPKKIAYQSINKKI